MRLQLVGHDEKYTVEQTLLALFPEEKLTYGTVNPSEDTRWAVIALEDREEDGTPCCHVTTEFSWDGKTAPYGFSVPLTGTDYEREGQRRHCLGMGIFRAAQAVTGIAPPWGSLTGIRPGKIAARSLEKGASEQETLTRLEKYYSVTPARARLALEAAQAGIRAKAELRERDVALYVGIPFCPTRCAYCSFVSASVEKSLSQVEPYLEELTEEIRSAARLVREQSLRVRTFYMGGGTPTTLSAEQMNRLLGTVEETFDLSHCTERTVEAGRPDTVTREKLHVLKERGVTRLSVNPQSMDDRVLQAIGRRHTAEDIRRAMDEVTQAGFRHVNMDLIAGLPADTPEGFCRSLEECIGFGADNLTVHTLSLKKGSAILTQRLPIPSAEEVGEMLDFADPTLRASGYVPYYLYRQKYMSGSFENVGWCMPGQENLYNIYIMEELCSILSMGAGGSTKMVGRGQICRAFNLKYPGEYAHRREKWQSNQAAFAAFYEAMKGADQ